MIAGREWIARLRRVSVVAAQQILVNPQADRMVLTGVLDAALRSCPTFLYVLIGHLVIAARVPIVSQSSSDGFQKVISSERLNPMIKAWHRLLTLRAQAKDSRVIVLSDLLYKCSSISPRQ